MVIKPTLTSGSKGVYFSADREDAIRYFNSLAPEKQREHVMQDFIVGDDLFYYAICKNGKVVISAIIKPSRLRHLITWFVTDAEIEQAAEKIIQRYKFDGPISIDFRKELSTGKVYLIEINPRTGANAYQFLLARVNWLIELSKICGTNGNSTQSKRIMTNPIRCCIGMTYFYLFFKLKLYRIIK